MIIYFSGNGVSHPEIVLGEKACVMLTYFNNQGKPEPRFQRILNARRKKKKETKRAHK